MLLQKWSFFAHFLLPFSESFSSSTTKNIFTVNTHCCMTFQHVLYGTKNKERCHPQTTASLQLQMSSKIFIKGYQHSGCPPLSTSLMMRMPPHSCNHWSLSSKVAVCCILWTMARTEQLLSWLEENPVDQHKLFSDSMKDAKDKGWQKHVVKGTKSEFYKLIAIFVFSVDVNKDVWDNFAANGGNYTKSVDNYLGQYVFCFILQLILISFLQVTKGVFVI